MCVLCLFVFVFFQAEDGIRDLVRSRGLGDVYKRQGSYSRASSRTTAAAEAKVAAGSVMADTLSGASAPDTCLLYTSDAADERSSVDLGGRRIIQKKTILNTIVSVTHSNAI